MKPLKLIGRRFLNGIGLVMNVFGVMAVIVICLALIAVVFRVLAELWSLGQSGIDIVLDRFGISPDWSAAALILLILVLILFVVGWVTMPYENVTVVGVEPGVRKEDSE